MGLALFFIIILAGAVSAAEATLEQGNGEQVDTNSKTANNINVYSSPEVDTTAPTVSFGDPLRSAVNVSRDKVITLTFSEPIKAGNMWIELKTTTGTPIPITTNITDSILTINHTTPLEAGKQYNLILHSGSITDLAGNPIALTTRTFNTTTDATKPQISFGNPLNNEVNVSRDKLITLNFNEPIKAGNLWIELVSSGGTSIPITTSISGNVLTITHTTLLAAGTKYNLILHTGSIKDLMGNSLALVSRTFNTTTDVTSPTITVGDPLKNAVNVPQNKVITLNFSEPIKAGNMWIELKTTTGTAVAITTSISGNVLTINHATLLDSGTVYNLILHTNCIKDLAGNSLSLVSRNFTVASAAVLDPSAPSSTVKITFIHHSSGGNWLANGNGNLGAALNANNYYVTESDYGWDAEPGDNLGDRTDTNNWPEWFTDQKMPYVYNSNYHSAYTNTISNPGGENEIIMFKSCFPLSEVGDSIDDEKAIYNSLKPYFAAHPEKLFVLITPPGETNVASYQLTRELCNWLVDKENGWLAGYSGKNVFAFDFYGVLSEVNSHHRYNSGSIEHVYAPDYDGNSPYHDGDDHPNSVGNQKATSEFLPLLNIAYNQWKA